MTVEPSRVEIRLDVDGRLIAAVTGAVGCVACAAGLAEPGLSSLQSAAAGVLREAFTLSEGVMPLTVSISRFADRIEIEVVHTGSAAPAIGLEKVAGFVEALAEGSESQFLIGGVDRVQSETQGSMALTRLTKYLGPPASAQ